VEPPADIWRRGAGLVSTAEDMLAFARIPLGGGAPVLSAEAARAMCSDQLTEAQKAHGGLGPDFFAGCSWGFGQAVLDSGAFGWDGGFGTSWLVDPVNDLIVIVLTQRMFETSQPPQVHQDIQAAAYTALA
jgi:CubicO group peptidase (beta-lactamase class C family)